MSSFMERAVGAAKLDVNIYEEVEADKSATGQAAAVVIIASIAAGIGSIVYAGLTGLILGSILALIGWVIWAALVWVIGTKLLPEPQTEADIGQLLRTIGFSAAPGVFKLFGFIPMIGGIIVLLASIWMLVSMVIGVRQALDYESSWRAVGVCIIGWIIQWLFQLVLFGGILSLLGSSGGMPMHPM